jgi:hypothetical protein
VNRRTWVDLASHRDCMLWTVEEKSPAAAEEIYWPDPTVRTLHMAAGIEIFGQQGRSVVFV